MSMPLRRGSANSASTLPFAGQMNWLVAFGAAALLALDPGGRFHPGELRLRRRARRERRQRIERPRVHAAEDARGADLGRGAALGLRHGDRGAADAAAASPAAAGRHSAASDRRAHSIAPPRGSRRRGPARCCRACRRASRCRSPLRTSASPAPAWRPTSRLRAWRAASTTRRGSLARPAPGRGDRRAARGERTAPVRAERFMPCPPPSARTAPGRAPTRRSRAPLRSISTSRCARPPSRSGSTILPPGASWRNSASGHLAARRRRRRSPGTAPPSRARHSRRRAPGAGCSAAAPSRLARARSCRRLDALDRVDLGKELRQHRRLVAAAGADLEHLPRLASVHQELDHARDDVRAARWSARSRSAARCPRRRGWRAPPRRTGGAAPSPCAPSTRSSRMPCSRSRSTMRARVRCEVMPMPRDRSCSAHRASHSRARARAGLVRKVHVQRRDRDALRFSTAWKSVPGPASWRAARPGRSSTRSRRAASAA